MEFKVGDKVKVVKCDIHSNCENINKISKIIKIENVVTYPYYLEDCYEPFKSEELELVEKQFTKADLKHGDKCTLKNGQVIFFDKTSAYSFESIDEQLRYFNDNVSIVKVERPVKYKTVFERVEEEKKEILDETEREYLKAVIKPFKKRVKFISKTESNMLFEKELLLIQLNDDDLILPYFEKETMYKGMELGKKYTLEELGI